MKPTVPDVRPDVERIYERSPVGCCLHIALDDFNLDDRSIEFCVSEAVKQRHADCEAVARKLLKMSQTQRRKVARGG